MDNNPVQPTPVKNQTQPATPPAQQPIQQQAPSQMQQQPATPPPPENKQKRSKKKKVFRIFIFLIPLFLITLGFLLFSFTKVGGLIWFLSSGRITTPDININRSIDSVVYRNYSPLENSPDGKIVFLREGNIWLINPTTKDVTKLTSLDINRGKGGVNSYAVNSSSNKLTFSRSFQTDEYQGVDNIQNDLENNIKKLPFYYSDLISGEITLLGNYPVFNTQIWLDEEHIVSFADIHTAGINPFVFKININNGILTSLADGFTLGIESEIDVDGGKIYLGADGTIYSIDSLTGSQTKILSIEGDSDPMVLDAINNNLLYVDQNNNTFYLRNEINTSTLSTEMRKDQPGWDHEIKDLAWSPDGNFYAYRHEVENNTAPVYSLQVTVRDRSGNKIADILPEDLGEWNIYSFSWSPDSSSMVLSTYTGVEHSILWKIDADSDTNGDGRKLYVVSRDGKLIKKLIDGAISPTWIK